MGIVAEAVHFRQHKKEDAGSNEEESFRGEDAGRKEPTKAENVFAETVAQRLKSLRLAGKDDGLTEWERRFIGRFERSQVFANFLQKWFYS